MPFRLFRDDGRGRVVIDYYGLVNTSEIYESSRQCLADPVSVGKLRTILFDYTDVSETAVDDMDTPRLIEIHTRASRYNADIIAVHIAAMPLLFGLGRMWEIYAVNIPWAVSVVRTREEAEDFVRRCVGIGDSQSR